MTELPVFIVANSGRCGSTLLSELLDLHPGVVSISEFLVQLLLSGVRHAEQPLTAQQFCAALQTRMPTTSALLRAGITVPEFRYPFHKQGVRFTMESGLPFPLSSTLSHLSLDPDSTFEKLMERILATKGTYVRDHLACTFQTLADMFGGAVIVERSGGSLYFTAELKALLPQASFVLLSRSGSATALSMSRHAYVRHLTLRSVLMANLGYDPYRSARRDGVAALPKVLQDQLPEHFTKAGFEALPLPLELFGAIWAHHCERGLPALPDRFHHVTYENLCADPRSTLRTLAEQIGTTPDPLWIDAAAKRVNQSSGKSDSPPEPEMALLKAACAPGVMAFAKKGIV